MVRPKITIFFLDVLPSIIHGVRVNAGPVSAGCHPQQLHKKQESTEEHQGMTLSCGIYDNNILYQIE
jgi:hypothetical protein